MRILHTSDWHVGRTFHGHPTFEALGTVLDALAQSVRDHAVDVVVVAGDVFDSAAPSADAYRVLTRALVAIRDAGALVVLTSGNHDSATRLGFQSEFTALSGIHVITRPEDLDVPVVVHDDHGPVHLFGIPYLEPALIRHRWPDVPLRTQEDVLTFAMDRVRAAVPDGARSVVLAHTFASSGARATAAETEAATEAPRDFTQGGVDVVPLSAFDGVTYAALGHIHSRARLAENVRYSGAPLHYSFGEAGRPRGAWLVELGVSGLEHVEWVALPVPRALAVLTGTLDELLERPELADVIDCWVRAILTDNTRPVDAMRRLQARFPHCAQLEHRPAVTHDDGRRTYAERVRSKSDDEVTASFLELVRNGERPSEAERRVIADLVSARRGAEATA
jgi:exonuclease SbcD